MKFDEASGRRGQKTTGFVEDDTSGLVDVLCVWETEPRSVGSGSSVGRLNVV